jgi:hypothetical protein
MDDQAHNDFAWWDAAVKGNRQPLDEKAPQCGFYRDVRNNRAVSIERGEGGAFKVFVSDKDDWLPKTYDKLNDDFGSWCMNPITYDDFVFMCENRRWPEDVEPYELDLPEDAPLNERIAAHIEKVKALADAYLASIGGKVETEAQSVKLQKYHDRLHAYGKKAEETRVAEKEPHLEASRAVDATWQPIVKNADALKKVILAPTTEYRVRAAAEARRKAEEAERAAREEQARIAAERQAQIEAAAKEAAAKGEDPAAAAAQAAMVAPQVPTVQAPLPKAKGFREQEFVRWDDRAAFWRWIATMNETPAALEAEAEKLVRKWIKDGVQVPGAVIDKKPVAR